MEIHSVWLSHGQPCHFLMRLPHLIRDQVAINIHGGADVSMSHELLLDCKRCSHSIEPRSVGVRSKGWHKKRSPAKR
jgi:hypothetical protein